jgi:hypothetical protein
VLARARDEGKRLTEVAFTLKADATAVDDQSTQDNEKYSCGGDRPANHLPGAMDSRRPLRSGVRAWRLCRNDRVRFFLMSNVSA